MAGAQKAQPGGTVFPGKVSGRGEKKKPLSPARDKGFESTLRYHSSWRGKTRPLNRSLSTPCTLTGTPGPTY